MCISESVIMVDKSVTCIPCSRKIEKTFAAMMEIKKPAGKLINNKKKSRWIIIKFGS
jgi:hypothetical protein